MTVVAAFAMEPEGHLRRLLPLVRGLADRGATVWVFTVARYAAEIEAAGGRPVDLFARYPLDAADNGSTPRAMRGVAYATRFAADLARDVAALGASLVLYDTFALVGRVVALTLGLPYVNVCAGHAVVGEAAHAITAAHPAASPAPECLAAVDILRTRYGMADASPFSYATATSPWLNVYCEPPAYLDAPSRAALEPVAFYGSLPDVPEAERRARRDTVAGFTAGSGPRVYASFGTVVWRYYAPLALTVMAAIADAIAAQPALRGLLSLGGAAVPADAAASLTRPNVAVRTYVDQWAALREADVFITHHGLNSTHEGIWHGVPMLSYPFFWDQPGLAARAQEQRVALPLVPGLRATVTPADVAQALAAVAAAGPALAAGLAAARELELAVMAGRPAVIDRIVALA